MADNVGGIRRFGRACFIGGRLRAADPYSYISKKGRSPFSPIFRRVRNVPEGAARAYSPGERIPLC